MKNKVLLGLLLACAVAVMIACNPKNEDHAVTVVDTALIKKEIQAKEDEFAATYNAREIKNIGYYAEDAISFAQNKKPLVGKKAIVGYLVDYIQSFPKSDKISFTTNEVFVSDGGNQVLEIGYYKMFDAAGTILNTGNYICLFVKRDGKYVCLRDMSASDIPVD